MVATWHVLINVTDNHRKYYSAEKRDGAYTGRVVFGRIGISRRIMQYPDEFTVRQKIARKLNEGYVELYTSHTQGFVRNNDVAQFSGPTTNPRARYAQAAVRRRRTTRRPSTVNFQPPDFQPPAYSVDRQGYIRKYRSNYKRNTPQSSQTARRAQYNVYTKTNFSGNRTLETKAKEFHDSIPDSQVNTKVPFGYGNGETFGRDVPKHFYVTKDRVFVAAFAAARNGECKFFYIKSDASNYSEIIDVMFKKIVNRADSGNYITINIASETAKDKLESYLNNKNITFSIQSRAAYWQFVINRTLATRRIVEQSNRQVISRISRWQDL